MIATAPIMSMKKKMTLLPTVLVIFGVTGNLSKTKLLPALYNLLKQDMLPTDCKVVGVFRDNKTRLDQMIQAIAATDLSQSADYDTQTLDRLQSIIEPFEMDSTKPADFVRLRLFLESLDARDGVKHQRLFYLAIPPTIFQQVISCLGQAGLNLGQTNYPTKLLLEKPFGTNLVNAMALVNHISHYFNERQIYRIDHYLAKETAQNILAFRFSNPLIEDVWGRQFIDHIQISALEAIDVKGRGNFYEGMGALRDIVQSHLLQLLSLTTMEAPKMMTSKYIHEEKLAVLNAIEPIKPNHVDEQAVRGQYAGYLSDVANPQSHVESYAALMLEIANSRWGGVPILLRTGKAMQAKLTKINVVFKDRFRRNAVSNLLSIRLQPNEGISLRLTAKKPGFRDELLPVDMDFSYDTAFDGKNPDAYERVLVDAIAGDQSLFATSAEVIRSWQILEPVLEHWQQLASAPDSYDRASWGPAAANDLANNFGSEWLV